MLSNSLGTALAMWDPQARAFATRHRLLRYDSRGHGRSAVPPGPSRSSASAATRWPSWTRSACGGSRSAASPRAAWSASGWAPTRRTGSRGWSGQHLGRIGAPEVWDQRIETVRAVGMGAFVPGVIDRWFTAPFRQGAPEAVAKVRAMLEATDPEGYVACCAAVRDLDLRDAIRGIKAPTLVIAGHHDLPTPPEHARLIADSVPGARMVTLDAAHLSNVEAQAEFTKAVLDFLAG